MVLGNFLGACYKFTTMFRHLNVIGQPLPTNRHINTTYKSRGRISAVTLIMTICTYCRMFIFRTWNSNKDFTWHFFFHLFGVCCQYITVAFSHNGLNHGLNQLFNATHTFLSSWVIAPGWVEWSWRIWLKLRYNSNKLQKEVRTMQKCYAHTLYI